MKPRDVKKKDECLVIQTIRKNTAVPLRTPTRRKSKFKEGDRVHISKQKISLANPNNAAAIKKEEDKFTETKRIFTPMHKMRRWGK